MNKFFTLIFLTSGILINNRSSTMKQPATTQPEPAAMTGAFFNLPSDVQSQLLKAIAKAYNKDGAAQAIHKLLKDKPELAKIVNTPDVTNDLINIIANKPDALKVFSSEKLGQEETGPDIDKVKAAISLGAKDWLQHNFNTNPEIKNIILSVYASLLGELLAAEDEEETKYISSKITFLDSIGAKEVFEKELKSEAEKMVKNIEEYFSNPTEEK